ncbi:MAG: hypothetical protein AAF623_21535, partial [Planctomycetota bacterium]
REPPMPFGTKSNENLTVSIYGSASSSSGSKKVSDNIMERVEGTLVRYDKNKNGRLDPDEIKRARWGNPSPEDSDLNKDGNLSKSELVKRYQSREDYYRKNSSERSKSSSSASKSKSRSGSSSSTTARRGSSSYSSTSTSTRNSRSSSSSSSSSSKSSASDNRDKYLRYAKNLIESYDKDEDGKLSKEEIGKMRRPPVGADVNKDGFVTESELIDNLTGQTSKSSSSKPPSSDAKSSSKTSSYRSRSGSRSSRSRFSSSSSMDSLDKNADKQIQMHEFSDEWTDEIVAEFFAIDKNRDGVISLKEWAEKSKK